ncbi:hypothetical protein [Chloroflexus aggregans]|nr:hypothetical protein [Chloroflexus aggregans]
MMHTIRTVCTPAENALAIRVSDQIEQLDALIRAEDNGMAFFERTYLT